MQKSATDSSFLLGLNIMFLFFIFQEAFPRKSNSFKIKEWKHFKNQN